jgi:hypothetical protein
MLRLYRSNDTPNMSVNPITMPTLNTSYRPYLFRFYIGGGGTLQRRCACAWHCQKSSKIGQYYRAVSLEADAYPVDTRLFVVFPALGGRQG